MTSKALKTAKAIARLKDIQINTCELIDDWILLTYDLPVNEEGNKARGKFLKLAPKIGAMMHSRSVYLMPATSQAQVAAVELSGVANGEVYIFTSKVDEKMAKSLTNFYDNKIGEQITEIEGRIQKMEQLILNEKFGMAERMRKKSTNLYAQLLFAAAQRGVGTEVYQKLSNIEQKLINEG